MGQFFSDKVEEGIRKVWMSFDKEVMQQGFALLEEAAQEGDADGYCFLARCYMGSCYVWSGSGFPVDDAMAARYVKESILRGSAAGVMCAMRCGELTPSARKNMPFKDLKEAFTCILEKAEAGHAFCQFIIGNAYYWGDMLEIEGTDEMMKRYPTEEDYDVFAYPIAAEWYRKALMGGLTFSFGNFSSIYTKGKGGIIPDPEFVEKWLKVVAETGDPTYQCRYGYVLEERGDNAGALHYYKMAAAKGDVIANYNVGSSYNRGIGTAVDKAAALHYFMEAAKGGDSDGEYQVGNFYFEGVGVEEDNAKAVYWLERSAMQDNAWAYPQLAMCYQSGWGVAKDHDRAFYLLSEAEKNLDMYSDSLKDYALNSLGNAYVNGNGVKEDIKRGVSYYDAAIAIGSENAENNRARFKKNLFGVWKRI